MAEPTTNDVPGAEAEPIAYPILRHEAGIKGLCLQNHIVRIFIRSDDNSSLCCRIHNKPDSTQTELSNCIERRPFLQR